MDDPDQKLKLQLNNAHELFKNGQYTPCRKLLSDIKATHLSIELNSLLCEYKENPQKIASVLKKLMDILVTVNIKIYQQRPKNQGSSKKNQTKSPRISHEFYFWNIIVLAQLLPNTEIAQLVSNEAFYFTDSLRTQTSFMVIYHLLNTMQSSSRLASCISLIDTHNKLIFRVRKLNNTEQAYRFLNTILQCKVLQKLGLIEDSRVMYMMKFKQNIEESKDGQDVNEINSVSLRSHQEILHAEIEYHVKNYSQSLKILGEIVTTLSQNSSSKKEYLKNIVDHNTALILINNKSIAPAQLLLKKTITFLTSNSKELQNSTEKNNLITKCKVNLLTSYLQPGNKSFQQAFQLLKQTQNTYSFKINYRKAQLCLNFYHQLLRNPAKVIPYKDVHDFYETVYYYPNLPYFQQKGKNKNPNYTNSKVFYRRYVLTPWQRSNAPKEEFVSISQKVANQIVQKVQKQERKQPSKEKKNEKGVTKVKKGAKKQQEIKEDIVKEQIIIKKDQSFEGQLREILEMAEQHLKEALIILQKQKSTIVNFQGEEKSFTEHVNQKLHNEYINYKGNILSLFCYLYLCKRQWIKTVRYAQQYQSFEKQYQINSKNPENQRIYYNVLTYKTQALCELSRIDKAYETLQDIIPVVDLTETTTLESRSTSSHEKGQTYFEKSSHYNNFGFNLSVLHSRDNKIPQAYNSIQKLLQQMRVIPSNPTANLPLSLIELLIHYNMRTGNTQSALQMVKRRRILNLPGVIGHYQPLLSVTK